MLVDLILSILFGRPRPPKPEPKEKTAPHEIAEVERQQNEIDRRLRSLQLQKEIIQRQGSNGR